MHPHPRAYTVSATRPRVVAHATARTRRSWGADDPARNPTSPSTRWRDLAHRMAPPDSPPLGRAPPRYHPTVEDNLHDLQMALQDLRVLMQSWNPEEAPWSPTGHVRSSSDATGVSSLYTARMGDAIGRLEELVGRRGMPYTPSGDSLDSMSDHSVHSMRAEVCMQMTSLSKAVVGNA